LEDQDPGVTRSGRNEINVLRGPPNTSLREEFPMKIVLISLLTIVALIVAGLAVSFSGIFNVAASVPENAITAWFLSTTMRRSVAQHASGGPVPGQFSDDQIHAGFRVYNETCVYCHGGPGHDPVDIGKGLNPEPPYLADTVNHWTNNELFWIIRNGIRMTGMPSFGATHKEEEIWNLVAFIKQLPKMTSEQYSQMEKQ
jgi:mono/diheme cytochrome c family protein